MWDAPQTNPLASIGSARVAIAGPDRGRGGAARRRTPPVRQTSPHRPVRKRTLDPRNSAIFLMCPRCPSYFRLTDSVRTGVLGPKGRENGRKRGPRRGLGGGPVAGKRRRSAEKFARQSTKCVCVDFPPGGAFCAAITCAGTSWSRRARDGATPPIIGRAVWQILCARRLAPVVYPRSAFVRCLAA